MKHWKCGLSFCVHQMSSSSSRGSQPLWYVSWGSKMEAFSEIKLMVHCQIASSLAQRFCWYAHPWGKRNEASNEAQIKSLSSAYQMYVLQLRGSQPGTRTSSKMENIEITAYLLRTNVIY
ncbi:hypothetical protein AVEN_141363-1 [Araneus ventricosus]|uniref:Uncharacterized protein n=1 Tax=Araneus ventricosus TaxID=182803 RepID=A0A4Y2CZA0_ARAVE|nr:hypothetical protein AVEN_141363-1 [Araneus ventricosus]